MLCRTSFSGEREEIEKNLRLAKADASTLHEVECEYHTAEGRKKALKAAYSSSTTELDELKKLWTGKSGARGAGVCK